MSFAECSKFYILACNPSQCSQFASLQNQCYFIVDSWRVFLQQMIGISAQMYCEPLFSAQIVTTIWISNWQRHSILNHNPISHQFLASIQQSITTLSPQAAGAPSCISSCGRGPSRVWQGRDLLGSESQGFFTGSMSDIDRALGYKFWVQCQGCSS